MRIAITALFEPAVWKPSEVGKVLIGTVSESNYPTVAPTTPCFVQGCWPEASYVFPNDSVFTPIEVAS